MKENIKKAATLFSYILVAGILSVFTYFSLNIIFNYAFTDEIGYEVYGTLVSAEDKDIKYEYLYTYEYPEGVNDTSQDEKLEKYQDDGYSVNIRPIRNSLNKSEKAILTVVGQLVCWFFSFVWVYKQMRNMGDKDSGAAFSKLKKLDLFRGLKITLIACIPAFLTYIGLIISYFLSFNLFMQIYLILNPSFWPVSHLFMSKISAISDMRLYHFAVLLLFQFCTPLVGGISYYIGYKKSFAYTRRKNSEGVK